MSESPAFSQARQRAAALAEAGNLDGARALLERAVEIGRAQLAGGDTELLATMRQLAGMYVRSDDPMAARRLLEEALDAGHRLSDADPLAVLLAYDLAVVAEELANRHVARTNFARVATFGPAVLGDDHPAVVRARAYGEPDRAAGPVPAPPTAPAPAPVSAPAPAPVSAPAPAPVAFRVEISPVPAAGPTSCSRTSWVLAALAVVAVTVTVAVIFTRDGDRTESAAPAQVAPATTGATSPATTGASPARPAPPAPPAPSASALSAAVPASTPSATPSRPVTTARQTTRPAPARTAPPAGNAVKTRIVAPANSSTVSWPFDAKFTVSAPDVAATGTVLSLSICVAGRCYLDGKLDIYGDVAAPYTVYLGSTKPEGTGVAWQLRVDRIAKAVYGTLVAERDAAIAAGTWGETGTRMGALNARPVSTISVTKGG